MRVSLCKPGLLRWPLTQTWSYFRLIVGEKKWQLRKGSAAPHADILLMCLINTLMGLFGLGWVSAPTIRSTTHVTALTLYSVDNVPGEKPKPVAVLEQRLTGLTVSALIGLSVLMAPVLSLIPSAVLFGVFLYMGRTSLDGVQLVDRTTMLLREETAPVGAAAAPRLPYVVRVRRWRRNLFTAIEIG